MKSPWANGLRLFALLLPLLGGRAVCAQAVAEEKPKAVPAAVVREIRVVDENSKVLKANPPGIAVKVGEEMSTDAVASSLRMESASILSCERIFSSIRS
jgi:hypothetical protein